MSYTTDRTTQLVEAHKKGRLAQKASLQAAGVPLPQHNPNSKSKKSKKADASKSAAKKTAAKSTTAKKSTAKKSAAKKTAKKS